MKTKPVLLALLFSAPALVWGHSEAFEIGPHNTDDLPRGKEADGIIGDFVLRNHHVQALVSGNLPLRRANMSTFYGEGGITPGCLYDLTFSESGNDQITIFSPAEQRGPVSWVRVSRDGSEGMAAVETVITAASNNGVYKRHEYSLDDDARGILIRTTLRNEANETRKQKVYDRLTAFSSTGSFGPFRWVDAVDPADRTGYAFRPLDTEKGPAGTDAEIELQPGQELEISRFLAVGSSPAEAVGIAARATGATGRLVARVRDAAGHAVSGSILMLRSGDQAVPAYADESGEVNIDFPEGAYQIIAQDLGRDTVQKEITISPGETTSIEFALSARSGIALSITDAEGRDMPCKAQFIGLDGTPSPNLGPANRAHGCKDQYHSETGEFWTAMPPGRYRVVVTRGIEYSHLVREVTVEPGETARIAGHLSRLVDTSGWVSADYHNHSTPSGDNTCGTDDRIINLAAEHIEFAPTTEHNRLYDWRPHIQKLGLSRFMNTVSGMELTGSGPHLNSFPFHPHPHTQDNGAPVWNRDPRISAILLRNHQEPTPDRYIQINHPDLVENFIDHNKDGLADGGYIGLGQLIDAIEVQNFSDSSILAHKPIFIAREQVYASREFVWLQLLNRGHRLIAMAVSDAHSVHGNGVGGWRMYMPSVSDEPAEIDWRENSRHAKAGRSTLTSGPFLQVQTADGQGPGSDVRASGGLDLQIRVQCSDWIDINRVQILVNGRPRLDLNFTRKTHPQMFGQGVEKFNQMVRVKLAEDAHLIVVAAHEEMNLSLGYGTSNQATVRPCAYNNPIFVDVDGGGFKANGDLLDYPLGGGKYSLEEAKKLLSQ